MIFGWDRFEKDFDALAKEAKLVWCEICRGGLDASCYRIILQWKMQKEIVS
jgi:hypothetical protein